MLSVVRSFFRLLHGTHSEKDPYGLLEEAENQDRHAVASACLGARLVRTAFAGQVSEFPHLSRLLSCLQSSAFRMGGSISVVISLVSTFCGAIDRTVEAYYRGSA